MQETRDRKRYMTPGEVAELLMVTPMTIRRWVNRGDLSARTTAGGHRRFLKRDVVRFAGERGMTLSPEDVESLRVLIVDDNKSFARFLGESLTSLPNVVEVDLAHNGFGAGIRLRDFRPHVVILELMMPHLNGFDVCREIKNDPATSSTDVVAMTTDYTEENAEYIIECGASTCLPKPIRFLTLLNALGFSYTASELNDTGLSDFTF